MVQLSHLYISFPGSSEVKESACSAGDLGSIPGLGRSPGEGNGTPLQYSCLENPMDRGAWRATVHGVAKSQTRLSNWTELEKPWLWLYGSLTAKWYLCFLIHCLGWSQLFFQEQWSFNFVAVVNDCSDLGTKENKVWHCLQFSPSICHEVMGLDAVILVFGMLSFRPALSLSSFTFIKRLFSSSSLCFLPLECYHLHIWGGWYFSWQSWFLLVIHPAWHLIWCTLDRI